jgi:hypothetical protein
VNPGEGLALQKIGHNTNLLVVDAIVSGTHESGTSHYELLRAFVPDETLDKLSEQLELHHYRSHEFGDSVFIEKMTRSQWQGCKSESGIPATHLHGKAEDKEESMRRSFVFILPEPVPHPCVFRRGG